MILMTTLAVFLMVVLPSFCNSQQDKLIRPKWAESIASSLSSPERTLDLSTLGIDLNEVFDRLLSPSGIVNQFALSLAIQLMFIIGYAVSGT